MKHEMSHCGCGSDKLYMTTITLDNYIKELMCNECSKKINATDRGITDPPGHRKCPACGETVHHINKYLAREAEKRGSMCKLCCLKYKKTKEYKDKLSKSSSGKGNPMYGKSVYSVWVSKYGVEEADRRAKERRKKASPKASGINNGMYGKPAPIGSGNGWGGWYNGAYFRSLKELSMMYWMDLYGIKWKTAERKEYVVKMENSTYRADFIVGNVLVEVKPKKLQGLLKNKQKQAYAIEFCRKNNLRYKIIDPTNISYDILGNLVSSGNVLFNERTKIKYANYLSKRK
jgi:hypothetical protein